MLASLNPLFLIGIPRGYCDFNCVKSTFPFEPIARLGPLALAGADAGFDAARTNGTMILTARITVGLCMTAMVVVAWKLPASAVHCNKQENSPLNSLPFIGSSG